MQHTVRKKEALHLTDKEFKRLSRAQLIDIIYQFQLQVDKLTEQNHELERELADKRIRLNHAGNIAVAALDHDISLCQPWVACWCDMYAKTYEQGCFSQYIL